MRKDPVYAIGVILAVGLVIFALYFVGPWYPGGPTAAIGSAFDTQLARGVVGVAYLIPSVGFLVGFTRHHDFLQRWGMFGTALGYAFVALLRFITIGPFPFVWLFMVLCALVAGVVYLYISFNKRVD